jgi:hypothetical protein
MLSHTLLTLIPLAWLAATAIAVAACKVSARADEHEADSIAQRRDELSAARRRVRAEGRYPVPRQAARADGRIRVVDGRAASRRTRADGLTARARRRTLASNEGAILREVHARSTSLG